MGEVVMVMVVSRFRVWVELVTVQKRIPWPGVRVMIDDRDVIAEGGGLGLPNSEMTRSYGRPAAPVVGSHLWAPTEVPVRHPLARCNCSDFWCGPRWVTICADESTVSWDLAEANVPELLRYTFDRGEYERELVRFQLDHSWESPAFAAQRLVRERVDHDELERRGLEWVWAKHYAHTCEFLVMVRRVEDSKELLLRCPGVSLEPLDRFVAKTVVRISQWTADL